MQVLDGPPGFTARRLSSFLLIPVGIAGRDLQFWAASLPGVAVRRTASLPLAYARQSISKKLLAKIDGCPDQVRA